MIAMAAPTEESTALNFANTLYERLPDELTYVAANWEAELLRPLGYQRCEQSAVAHALLLLVEQGRITRETVRRSGGHQITRRNLYPKPRRVTIRKIM